MFSNIRERISSWLEQEGDSCGICYEEFNNVGEKWTHRNELGEEHASFHKQCIEKWLTTHNTCPHDQTIIGRNLLVSRSDLPARTTGIDAPPSKIRQIWKKGGAAIYHIMSASLQFAIKRPKEVAMAVGGIAAGLIGRKVLMTVEAAGIEIVEMLGIYSQVETGLETGKLGVGLLGMFYIGRAIIR